MGNGKRRAGRRRKVRGLGGWAGASLRVPLRAAFVPTNDELIMQPYSNNTVPLRKGKCNVPVVAGYAADDEGRDARVFRGIIVGPSTAGQERRERGDQLRRGTGWPADCIFRVSMPIDRHPEG